MGKNLKRDSSSSSETEFSELSQEEMAQEEALLKQLPYLNIGAFVCTPVWGLAHGDLIVVLLYPLWLFVDNLIYSAYQNPTVLSVVLATFPVVVMMALCFAYARIAQVNAAHKALAKGKTVEQYLKTERIWTIAMCILAVVVIALATYYNLEMRVPFE